MEKLWQALDRLDQIKKDKLRDLRERSARRTRALNVEDLTRRFHELGSVRVPYPTLFAKVQIERHYGGMEKIDLSRDDHVAGVLWFFENGENPEIADWPREKIEAAIARRMVGMSLAQVPEYAEAVIQIMLAIKKKSNADARRVLETIQTLLGNPASPAAPGPLS